MPSPQVAAVAVMALLAAGVVLGSVDQPARAERRGRFDHPRTWADPRSRKASPKPRREPARSVDAGTGRRQPSPAEARSRTAGSPGCSAEPAPTAAAAARTPRRRTPAAEIKHVFLIVLDGHGYEEAFGEARPRPTWPKRWPAKASCSPTTTRSPRGAWPTRSPCSAARGRPRRRRPNCPEYTEIAPGTVSAEGQVEGEGCVYPAETETLPGQLVDSQADLEGLRRGHRQRPAAGQPTTCRHPALGAADADAGAPAGRCLCDLAQPVRLLPLVADRPECAESDVGLDQLGPGPEEGERRPRPSPTSSPTPATTAAKRPAHPDSPPAWPRRKPSSKTVVPEITASPAYRRRRPDRDHLRPGAADRPERRHQLLLRHARIPEPAAPGAAAGTARHRAGETERRRRPGRHAADLALVAPGTRQRNRLLQPLLLPAQRRGTVRPRTARLRRRTGLLGVRQTASSTRSPKEVDAVGAATPLLAQSKMWISSAVRKPSATPAVGERPQRPSSLAEAS